jgi:hypothetical protein
MQVHKIIDRIQKTRQSLVLIRFHGILVKHVCIVDFIFTLKPIIT